jgi:hypothetical protein
VIAGVEHLELTLLDGTWPFVELPALQWPALRSLDLSHNAIDTPIVIGSENPLFAQLPLLGVAPQLRTLHLPPPCSAVDVRHVQDALDVMPALVRLVVRGIYAPGRPTLRHPTAQLDIARPRPWHDIVGTLEIDGIACELHEAAIVMDRCHFLLPMDAADAWDQLWLIVEHLASYLDVAELAPEHVRALFSSPMVDCWLELRAHLPRDAVIARLVTGLRVR